MKNILYIAPYRQKDGWGVASYNYLKSIIYSTKKLNYNLKIAPVYFTGQVWDSIKVSKDSENKDYTDIVAYETNNLSSFDTIIQVGLPESLYHNYGTKNIGLTLLETQKLYHTKNKYILNKLDHILVPSLTEKNTLEEAGVTTRISDILLPIDCAEIDSYIENNQPVSTKYNTYTKYYFIGEFVNRKNIIDLIISFSLAFRSTDKCVLFIKTSSYASIDYINSIVNKRLAEYKHAKLNKNIIFLNKRIPRVELLNLHHLCDIFICPSQGESFCIPLAEAMRFGNVPIAVENTSPVAFVNKDNGYIIPASPEICMGNDDGTSMLDSYSSRETWMRPSLYDMINIFKQSNDDYQINKNLMMNKKILSRKMTNSFEFSSIGDKICSLDIM